MNAKATSLLDELRRASDQAGRRVQLMEVCGTHTVSAFRSGIRSLLPENVRLVSGPGCPVCVTAQRHIDAVIELAARDDVLVATYGDMMRVPGRRGSLEQARAAGARVHVINSARGALRLAREHPRETVVFLAVGFETTAPATAAIVLEAERSELTNLSVLSCHKVVVPAMLALLAAGDVAIDGFLCPSHVTVIIGWDAYRPVVRQFHKPCVVADFEPNQILRGLLHLVRQIGTSRPRVENVYQGVVNGHGNPFALALLQRVFVPGDTTWRGLGAIPASGLELASGFRRYDAVWRFGLSLGEDHDNPCCRCGDVIKGNIDPDACPLFGSACTPLTPIGPCMVSSEGTCAAWFKYRPPGEREVSLAQGGVS